MKRFIVILFSLFLVLSFVACSEDDPATVNYTVTFDSQSADTLASPTNRVIADGETLVSLPSDPIKANYAFGGWFTEVSGGGTEFTASTVVTDDITVYAKWDILTYTVIYNGDGSTGGTVPIDSSSYTNGEEVTVLSNTGSLVKTNSDGISLSFSWNTQADGNGTDYVLASGAFTMGFANVDLYAKWSVLRGIGPAGGLVFHDKGSYSDGWRYLEAALSDQTLRAWGTYPSAVSDADGIAIGTGLQNTIDITNGDILANKAADECVNLSITNNSIPYNDWFLPSQDELNKMYVNLHSGTDENNVVYTPVGGFASSYYWSSSEYNTGSAWLQSFGSGGQYIHNKNDAKRVRAVRDF